MLKRFEFDFSIMQKVKVNDYLEFPMELNLKPWTKQGIFNIIFYFIFLYKKKQIN